MDSNATESASQRQGRAGRWQYPGLGPDADAETGAQQGWRATQDQPAGQQRAARE